MCSRPTEHHEKSNYKINFLEKFKNSSNLPNVEALSNCYFNYKKFDVSYSSGIMNIIYEYEQGCANFMHINVDNKSQNNEVVPQHLFYKPKNFYSAQSKVGFKFVNFVRSTNSSSSNVPFEPNSMFQHKDLQLEKSIIRVNTSIVNNNPSEKSICSISKSFLNKYLFIENLEILSSKLPDKQEITYAAEFQSSGYGNAIDVIKPMKSLKIDDKIEDVEINSVESLNPVPNILHLEMNKMEFINDYNLETNAVETLDTVDKIEDVEISLENSLNKADEISNLETNSVESFNNTDLVINSIETSHNVINILNAEIKSPESLNNTDNILNSEFQWIDLVESADKTDNKLNVEVQLVQSLKETNEGLNNEQESFFEKDVSVLKEVQLSKECESSDLNIIKLSDGIVDLSINDVLKKFQELDFNLNCKQWQVNQATHILNNISSKSKMSTSNKYHLDADSRQLTCEIFLNDNVLIGTGTSVTKKKAFRSAWKDFHRIYTKIFVKNLNFIKLTSKGPDRLQSSLFDRTIEMFKVGNLNDFYILNYHDVWSPSPKVLKDAFQYFKMSMNFEGVSDKLHLIINESLLARMPLVENLSTTKVLLSDFVLKELKKTKWILIRKTGHIDEIKESVETAEMYQKNLSDCTKLNAITNIGGQLMLKMGWNGYSGLGKTGNGIKDPIETKNVGIRRGIGFDFGSSKDFRSFSNNVSKYLKKWRHEDDDDIIFDHEFDTKERSLIHVECRKLGLTSKSYNDAGGKRRLVVSVQRSPQQLFEWVQSKGGTTKLYTLVPPQFDPVLS